MEILLPGFGGGGSFDFGVFGFVFFLIRVGILTARRLHENNLFSLHKLNTLPRIWLLSIINASILKFSQKCVA